MEPKLTAEEEALVEKHLRSPEVLKEWNISPNRRNRKIALVAWIVVCSATLAGIVWYLVFTDPVSIYTGIQGFFIVIALAIVTVLLRAFQLRIQHQNCEKLLEALRQNLTGDPERDIAIQEEIEAAADWGAKRLDWAGYMIAIAMVLIATINMSQGSMDDLSRSMVYVGCVAVFAFGQMWHMFAFNDEVLTTELRARVEAAVRFQKRNMRTESFEPLGGGTE